jgi:threonylcarbamoyladenosine tRNA methylthiotransferase MtaB
MAAMMRSLSLFEPTVSNLKGLYKVVTLGCRTNQYESQAYRDQLGAIGWTEAKERQKASLCIVNTCTVTESADSSSRHQIRQLVRENPGARIIVTGCFAERKPGDVLTIEGVDLVVSNRDKEELVAKLFPQEEVPEFSIRQFEAHTRAFVKVQDGCNSFCTYCIIPYVRGRSRCRPIEAVLKECETLISQGYKEIVITGINVGDYEDSGKGLADLMAAVDRLPGLERLRLSSIDPDEVDDHLLDVIVNGKHTCQSMHIVLQSGSNAVLKRMNRKYTKQMFFKTVERLKEASPDFTFTTDLIVGFPGETEADFQDSLEVMQEVQFAKVHMFPYSKRERTRAALYKEQVPSDVIKERKRRVLELDAQCRFELCGQYLGRTMQILAEGGDSDWLEGHTDNFLPVKIPAGHFVPNQLLDVQLVENRPDGLIGEVVTHALV